MSSPTAPNEAMKRLRRRLRESLTPKSAAFAESLIDAALRAERLAGREEAKLHVGHTPCCFLPSHHKWADPIRCLEDHQNWPCDAVAGLSGEEPSA